MQSKQRLSLFKPSYHLLRSLLWGLILPELKVFLDKKIPSGPNPNSSAYPSSPVRGQVVVCLMDKQQPLVDFSGRTQVLVKEEFLDSSSLIQE